MNCELYQEQISALIDGEIEAEGSADVFAHLGKCATCRAFHHDIQRIHLHIAEGPLPAVSHTLDARVRTIPLRHGWRELLGIVRTGAAWWQRRLQIPVPAFGMLVLMLLASVAIAVGLFRSPQPQAEPVPTMYIMSLSPIEVHPSSSESSSRIQ